MINKDLLHIIYTAKSDGIKLFVKDGKLGMKKSKSTLISPALTKQIQENKEALIQFLGKGTTTSNIPSIKVMERPSRIPLSFAQERLWFLDQLQGSVAYHISGVLKITGDLNILVLQEALQHIVDRHESLRTVFKDHDGIGYQEIKSSNDFKVAHIQNATEEIVTFQIEKVTKTAFDLSKDYMFRAVVVSINETDHRLILVLHHIASDGWSLPILVKELEASYGQLLAGNKVDLPTLPVQYADYSSWQRNYLSGEVLTEKLAFWNEKLKNASPLEIPTDFTRPSIQSTEGNVYSFTLNKELTKGLHNISKIQESTLFMTLLGIYKILLYKYTRQTDISVGTPIANRQQENVAGLIGLFVNTIVLRDQLQPNASFITLLKQIKETCLTSYMHQDVPFEQIVDDLALKRDQSRTPLFQTLFVLQNNEEVSEVSLGNSIVSAIATTRDTAKFDLTLNVTEENEEILVEIEYATTLFKAETIVRMAQHFKLLSHAIVDNTNQPISTLTIIGKEEQNTLLNIFNNTKKEYPSEKTVVDYFKEQVLNTPDAIAVVFENTKLTYVELDKKSNQVAFYLQEKGIIKNSLVPICTERSLEMYIGILGILKSGGAYVPIDTKNPIERIQFILKDVDSEIILTTTASKELVKVSGKESIYIDELINASDNLRSPREINIVTSQLAYVIYTSGTTGNPKGVMNAHSGLLNRLLWMQDDVNITSQSILLQKTPYVFDVSVWELLMPLISGCTLVMATPEGHKDPDYLQKIITSQKVTHIHFVPSMLEAFVTSVEASNNNSLSHVICSGEALSAQLVKKFKEKFTNTRIHNYYGPTEAAIDVTKIDLTAKEYEVLIPIGKPVANTTVYIVDDAFQLCPIGVQGELLIGGIQVAKGYINRKELTEEKFILSPFKNDERLYKTGDIAKWLPDGNIQYLGRKDDQVKIKGFRIELGEIEAALRNIQYIEQAVVIVWEDANDNKQLVAYVIATEEIDNKAIQKEIAKQLPDYMIPKLYMQLESFPLTTNGKIDKKSLPLVDDSAYQKERYVAPSNEVEEKLVTIWQDLLGVKQIGIYDNFFELGGDSIKAIQLVSRSKSADIHYQVKDIFSHQTISEIALHLKDANEIIQETGILEGYVQLHPIQKQFFDLSYEAENHYNQSLLLTLSKEIKPETIQKAIELLANHHDVLRIEFQKVENESYPIQNYGNKLPELITENITETTEITELCSKYQADLDIYNNDLTRFVFIETKEDTNRLFMGIHHLAIDGVSWRIFLEDFTRT
uniref:amino acid adenylation domain-containing protein n=2 Tax=uncultured Kordia sp. TaxID=507699 RepID=UPI002602E675